jgi:hypothetical protein
MAVFETAHNRKPPPYGVRYDWRYEMFNEKNLCDNMKQSIISICLVISLIAVTNIVEAAVTVTDHPAPFDVLTVPDFATGNGPSGATQHFGFDVGESTGQIFTLDSAINLGSIYVGYSGYNHSSTMTLIIDVDNDGVDDYTFAGLAVSTTNVHAGSSTGPFSYFQFDLSSENIVLAAGQHAYELVLTAEEAGTSTWAWAPSRNDGDTYAGGNSFGVTQPDDDLHFAVTRIGNNIRVVFNPNPSNGATGVSITTDLTWHEPTDYIASSYDVYFGTEPNAYNNPKYTVTTNSFIPTGDLELDTVYHWVVDSYDGPTKHAGGLWNFTTESPLTPGDGVVGNMIMINDNAGWCWYQDEKVIYDPVAGSVITNTVANYMGYGGEPRDGDIDTTAFNLATGSRTRVVMANIPTLSKGDDHNVGALWQRPDGRYLTMYTGHNYGAGYNDTVDWGDDYEPRSFWRISSQPNDGSVWQDEQVFTWPENDTISPINNDVTYSNLHYLSAEGSGMGRLYNIARAADRTPNIMYSDDYGENWVYGGKLSQTDASDQSGQYTNGYFKFTSNGIDRIDFIATEHHPHNYNTSIYHGYIQGGKSYDSFGSMIDDNIFDETAPAPNDFTPVFTTSPVASDTYHHAWTVELELDQDDRPVGLFSTRYGTEVADMEAGDADHRLFYARFDGLQWVYTELAKMGIGLHPGQNDYTGLGAIHPDNSCLIYISTPYDPRDDTWLGVHEIFKGVSHDQGATWQWTQITFNSTVENLRPAIPSWNANKTAVFWLRGTYPYQRDYDQTLVGIIDRHGETIGHVTYIDADSGNTTMFDGSAFVPSSISGTNDDQWHEYTGYGNAGSCYTANDNGTEDAPLIKTVITGLQDGTYDIFAFFWAKPDEDWRISGGFSESDMLVFRRQSSQHAQAGQFAESVDILGSEAALYRAYIGRKEVVGGSVIDVYIDDVVGSNANGLQRTAYDGIGVASVLHGDLTADGKVDLYDMAELSQGWQSSYSIDDLLNIADDWLK